MEEHPKYGRVYYVGSAEDVLRLMERERLIQAMEAKLKTQAAELKRLSAALAEQEAAKTLLARLPDDG